MSVTPREINVTAVYGQVEPTSRHGKGQTALCVRGHRDDSRHTPLSSARCRRRRLLHWLPIRRLWPSKRLMQASINAPSVQSSEGRDPATSLAAAAALVAAAVEAAAEQAPMSLFKAITERRYCQLVSTKFSKVITVCFIQNQWTVMIDQCTVMIDQCTVMIDGLYDLNLTSFTYIKNIG